MATRDFQTRVQDALREGDADRRRAVPTWSRVDARSVPPGGPQATTRALARVADARAIVLVEGISDQIALETLAARRGRNLEGEGVLVVPIGGAQAVRRKLPYARLLVGALDGGRVPHPLAGVLAHV